MPTSLSKDHRKLLEKTTANARVLAESACRAALENLAVHEKEYRSHMSVEQRLLRNRLRARGRALGDKRDERSSIQDIRRLTELAAYEHWHRLLFTRFLTENHLLIADEANGFVPVTLEDCEELALELGARDGLDLACRFASLTLPGIFRRDDPVLDLPIALNDQVELRKLLASLSSEAFRADDALGWTYQFWQAQRKDEINKSGKKIGADEISPVTQLFTEDYMVEFLLHNTIGAWWAGKRKDELVSMNYETEEAARRAVSLPPKDGVPGIEWKYLRFVKSIPHDEVVDSDSSFIIHTSSFPEWFPAAGTFDGWPKSASLIRLLDPCMGSGHFLVFALPLLVRLRMEEENLSAQATVVAVLKDNIHGLELDERCTQIAAFNVALTAWKLAGYQVLPSLNLACSGLAPSATEAEWVALAGDNSRACNGMASLHRLFKDAPVLGSLINPRAHGEELFDAKYYELAPLLEKAMAQEVKDDIEHELAVTARGLAKAAEILNGQFTLVATNVPYLGRGKQEDTLKNYCESIHPEAKADLATCFVERCVDFCAPFGTAMLVTPQNWFFLGTYKKLRQKLFRSTRWNLAVKLGPSAFQNMNFWAAKTALCVLSRETAKGSTLIAGFDVSETRDPSVKATLLLTSPPFSVPQLAQLNNPDARLLLSEMDSLPLLEMHGSALQGIATADYCKFGRCFWELPHRSQKWQFQQSTVEMTSYFSGREHIFLWEDGKGALAGSDQARIQGLEAIGKFGVAVSQMNLLPVTLFTGEFFDNNCSALVVREKALLAAVWTYCSSEQFLADIREIDQAVKVTNASLVKVPFDLSRWQKEAVEKYPLGLPKPFSCDPTQWLFNGHPAGSTQPLHVAVARLLGYCWPRQTGSSFPDCPAIGPDGLESFADEDGIVCLPPLTREQPAAARLRQLLAAALGALDERALIAAAGLKGSKSTTLEDWLRDEFFEQHAKLFHDRPFIWHLWDGRPDGFHALVNYHMLDHSTLQKLTYSYLGNWIQQQSDDAKADKPGAAERLGAARTLQIKLAAILEGEAPLDIFVRWKPLKEQAQGWQPDINDGIRQNIRPFLMAGDVGKRGAGLFRSIPLKLKDKDRGTEPHRSKADYPWFWCEEAPGADPTGGKDFVGNRWNGIHLTLARKKEASS